MICQSLIANQIGLIDDFFLYRSPNFCDNAGMTTATKIHETVAQMARPKAARRPIVPRLETALTATPERMAKPDYYDANGSRKKCRVLDMLRKADQLSAESETVAEQWIADYQYANFGYGDFMRGPLPDDYIKGDQITFGLTRARGAHRISIMRDNLGVDTHQFMVRLLISEHSFSAMARDMLPDARGTEGGKAVRERAVMLLATLPALYRAACKEQKRLAEEARK